VTFANLTVAPAMLSKNIDADTVIQLTNVARRTFATCGVIAMTYIATSCEKNIAKSVGTLQSCPTAKPRLTRPAVAGFLASDITRCAILQLVFEILQAGSGESHWNRRVMAVHQLVVRWPEIQILLGPRGNNVVASASIMTPYSIFIIFLNAILFI